MRLNDQQARIESAAPDQAFAYLHLDSLRNFFIFAQGQDARRITIYPTRRIHPSGDLALDNELTAIMVTASARIVPEFP